MPAMRGTNDLYLACITACWVKVLEAYSIQTVTLLRNACREKREQPSAARPPAKRDGRPAPRMN